MNKANFYVMLALLVFSVVSTNGIQKKCPPGQVQFYGKCKKVDDQCIAITCPENHRCKNGQCIPQLVKPKLNICKPLGLKLKRTRCNSIQLRQRCQSVQPSSPVCGYTKGSDITRQFDNSCQACRDNSISFIFETSCKWAPKVCATNQECFNGICRQFLQEQQFKNNRCCNKNKDCKLNEKCMGHKCVQNQVLFNYLGVKTQSSSIGTIL